MPVLQFKGKTAVECHHHTVSHHTLEFDPKLSMLGKGEKCGLDGNLIIEGDNLLALKALLPTHAGRIKCIYIDPPYNTGNEGWVYNDLYTPDGKKDRALDMTWLKALDKTERNRSVVVYCEKIWVHRDDLAKYQTETKRTVRPMLVPFSLK